jgi:hypothetical protein
MRAFFLAWPEILQALSAISRNSNPLAQIAERFSLVWFAYVRLLSVEDCHTQRFYETEALKGGWIS